jgi:hypothetical protein
MTVTFASTSSQQDLTLSPSVGSIKEAIKLERDSLESFVKVDGSSTLYILKGMILTFSTLHFVHVLVVSIKNEKTLVNSSSEVEESREIRLSRVTSADGINEMIGS